MDGKRPAAHPAGSEPAQSVPAHASMTQVPASPIGILVVDDNLLVAGSTVTMLEQIGYRALEALDGESALDVLDRSPEVGLMVTDIGLPGMSGYDLALEARRRRPDLRIIFVTGYDRKAMAERIKLDDSTDLLGKPYQPLDLIAAIRRLLAAACSADRAA